MSLICYIQSKVSEQGISELLVFSMSGKYILLLHAVSIGTESIFRNSARCRIQQTEQ